MTTTIIRFLNMAMVALVAGTIFGILIGYNPKGLSAPTFIEQQQSAITALNSLMPILGFITILLTLTSAFQQKKEKKTFFTLLVAAGFLIVTGLITRFGNQPINSIVMTWDMNQPPADWASLRDQWWNFHMLRTLTGVTGMCLIFWTGMKRD